MSLLADFEEDLQSQLFDAGGVAEKIIYKSAGGETKTVLAVIELGNQKMPNADEKNRAYMDALFSIRDSDLSNPRSGDKIIYNGDTYDFYTVQEHSSLGITILRFVRGRTGVTFK
jgi:hypothetical protein